MVMDVWSASGVRMSLNYRIEKDQIFHVQFGETLNLLLTNSLITAYMPSDLTV